MNSLVLVIANLLAIKNPSTAYVTDPIKTREGGNLA